MAENKSVRDLGEFGLIDRIESILPTARGTIGIGDDTAVIDQPGTDYLLATVDMLVDGIHFLQASVDPFELGRRAIAVNVSDIAAMGGTPTYALTSVALPENLAVSYVDDMYRGIRDEAKLYGLVVVGGNTARIDGGLVIDVVILGVVPKDRIALREGAVPGDVLAVTGTLGRAAATREIEDRIGRAARLSRFPTTDRVPRARLEAGKALTLANLVHAMMDVSDGLAGDAHHIATRSHVGMLIDAARLPIDNETNALASELGIDPTVLALSGGEDYELLIALDPADLEKARRAVEPMLLSVVGQVLDADHGVQYKPVDGPVEPLRPTGWTHF